MLHLSPIAHFAMFPMPHNPTAITRFSLSAGSLLMRLLLAATLVSSSYANAAQPMLPCRESDPTCAAEKRLQNPVKSRGFWSETMNKPILQRIGTAPDELLVFHNLDNIAVNIPNRPRRPEISDDFLADVRAVFADLPPQILKLIEPKLAGIYFVQDLGGTAMTDYIDGGWFRRDIGWIVLDAGVLSRYTANAWATWKERTPFKESPAFSLEAVIETPANDNRRNAIRYILLHETGHILSLGEKIHPRWDKPPSTTEGFPFAQLSWQLDAATGTYVSHHDRVTFRDRQHVVYYFGAKLAGYKIPDIYDSLSKTNFPTLYAATNPGDDFAESFASYVHTVIHKRPWEIRVFADGKLAKTYRTCWEETRCAEKRKLLERFLGLSAP
jgi:hypothetical protein